jgi:hypothetical protein
MKSTGENRQLGEKPVPAPLCPPQISHGLDPGSNPGLRDERPATNRLSHGTAIFKDILLFQILGLASTHLVIYIFLNISP